MNDWVLKIDNLSVGFGIAGQARPVTEGVSLTIARGETLALVGESGSGKIRDSQRDFAFVAQRIGALFKWQHSFWRCRYPALLRARAARHPRGTHRDDFSRADGLA